MWRKPPHGLSIPYFKNAMLINAFDFMRRNIQFSDNPKINQKFVRGYDPLLEVSYPLQIMMKGMRGRWTAVKYVTIYESVIKYMDRAITYVQYIPEKQTKHGIKVFAIYFTLSTVLQDFKFYVG